MTFESDSDETKQWLAMAAAGDALSFENLLLENRDRLSRMIAWRMDPRLCRRVDVDDILQEVHLQAFRHLRDYVRRPEAPYYVWLRAVALNVLREQHRRHLGTRMRDAHREVRLHHAEPSESSSQAVGEEVADPGSSPSRVVMQLELWARVQNVINSLAVHDREIVQLRHFEQLSPIEIAHVLGISKKAVSMRYLRALQHVRELLEKVPGGTSVWTS